MLNDERALAGFAAAIGGAAPDPAVFRADAGIPVYRNNSLLNRTDALAAAFPTVAQLIGEQAFWVLARDYVRATPLTSVNLHQDGAALADFIDTYAPAAAQAYLADVARFDWARHRAYYAEDIEPLPRSAIETLDAGHFMRQRLYLHPCVHLVCSARWPIADIQAMHEGGATASLQGGAQAVMVWRQGGRVEWQALDAAGRDLLRALLAGAALGVALQAPAQNGLLAMLFAEGLVTGLEALAP